MLRTGALLDLDVLNRAQLEAVVTTEGPLLVLAGAGSGKTRVITYRLAYLLQRGVDPKSVLCVTFTNKAANEMKERAKSLAGRAARGATISTFHALGVKILRGFGERVGLKPSFAICDGAEQIGTVRRILRDLRIDDRKFDPKVIQAEISRVKNRGLDAAGYRAVQESDEVVSSMPRDGELSEEYVEASIETYERYELRLRAQNLVDFDDLLLLTLRLLREDDGLRQRLERKWRYLMIDEYQDTNGAQLEIMRLLAGTACNLCAVGDDDQSIYGWRGAEVRNILEFDLHFPGARRVTLDTNYRSSGHILAVANAIIAKNAHRFPKVLRPATGEGERVRVVALEDEEAEAEEIARSVLALTAQGVAPAEIAVLFRSNVQSRPIELAMRRAHVPYRVVGGTELFDKKEVKDAIAYLRILDNAQDEQSLRRVVNFPPRGIGDASIDRVDDWARARALSLVDALERAHEVPGVPPKAQDAIVTFLHLLKEHRRLLARQKASTVARKLIAAVKLEEVLFDSSDNAVSAERRVDNVREIVRQIERFEDLKKLVRQREAEEDGLLAEPAALSVATVEARPNLEPMASVRAKPDMQAVSGAQNAPTVPAVSGAESAPTVPPVLDEVGALLDGAEAQLGALGSFLSELSMGSAWEGGEKVDRKDQVLLSTIHAAKGLEWLHVFLVGCEEDLLPHRRTVAEGGSLDEERRLAYVATTRARRHLTLSYAVSRTRWGRIEPRLRSRFLTELPEESVTWVEGVMKQESSPQDQEAVRKHWAAKIRAQLGIDPDAGRGTR